MAVDKKGNVYLTGTSQGIGTYYDYATVKFSEMPTNVSGNNIQPLEFNLEQNYPNPFNPITTISYQLPKSGFVNITVYDISGKEIIKLVNEFKEVGSYDITVNASDLSSGIYFYSLKADGFTDTKKMIVIK